MHFIQLLLFIFFHKNENVPKSLQIGRDDFLNKNKNVFIHAFI